MMQYLDEGYGTSEDGTRVSFSDVFFIMTGNLGSEMMEALRVPGEAKYADVDALNAAIWEEIRQKSPGGLTRPEVLNRIGNLTEAATERDFRDAVFLPFTREVAQAIGERELDRRLESFERPLVVRDAVRAHLAESVAEAPNGRIIKSLLDRTLFTPLVRSLSRGSLRTEEFVAADWVDGELVVEPMTAEERDAYLEARRRRRLAEAGRLPAAPVSPEGSAGAASRAQEATP